MKRHYLFAITVLWNPDPSAEGFRIYYQRVKQERYCDDNKLPTTSIKVGDVTSYTLDPAIFVNGAIYEVRASAYSGSFETPLTPERLCIKMDLKDKGPKMMSLPGAKHTPPDMGMPIQSSTDTMGKPIEERENETKPEAPTEPFPVSQKTLIAGTIPTAEDADYDAIYIAAIDDERYGWDSTASMGTPQSEPRWGSTDPERVEFVLGTERPSVNEQVRLGSNRPTKSNTRPLRVNLLQETYTGGLARGQRVLFRGDSVRDDRHPVRRVSAFQQYMRASQNWFTENSYWIAIAVIISIGLCWKTPEESV